MSDIPREPSEYRPDPGGHFRRKKQEREIPGPAIRECIENGKQVGDGFGEKVRLRAEWGGVAYFVVVNPSEGYAVTCGHDGS